MSLKWKFAVLGFGFTGLRGVVDLKFNRGSILEMMIGIKPSSWR